MSKKKKKLVFTSCGRTSYSVLIPKPRDHARAAIIGAVYESRLCRARGAHSCVSTFICSCPSSSAATTTHTHTRVCSPQGHSRANCLYTRLSYSNSREDEQKKSQGPSDALLLNFLHLFFFFLYLRRLSGTSHFEL